MAEPLHKQIHDEAFYGDATQSAGWEAEVSTTATSEDEPVMVTIESFDGGVADHGPCYWMPRALAGGAVAFPSQGDHALVVFNEVGDPWIVAWWPF
jgi:hypothetical protein